MSRFLFRSLRDTPAEAENEGHAILLRGGYVRPLGPGLFTLTPLGLRVMRNIARVLGSEMESLGVQEVSMPLVQPAGLWRESGRWDEVGVEMVRVTDRGGQELCLAMTHEEAATHLAREMVHSWRQLPFAVYQVQSKFRDEPKASGGLMRTREFMMKDAYSFHATKAELDDFYSRMHQAYERIFARCGLDVRVVQGHSGMMGGNESHEFMVMLPIGQDTVLSCATCGYVANRQVARSVKPSAASAVPGPRREIATPDAKTIRQLAKQLDVPESATAKAILLMAEPAEGSSELIFAVVRGDTELNERKLSAALGTARLRPATELEIRSFGVEPGYASPIGIERNGVRVVVDDLVAAAPALIAGANRAGYHYADTRYGRDFEADLVADISLAAEGDGCSNCGAPLQAEKAVEVGNIFQLGTRYSEAMKAGFRDKDGAWKPFQMGSYGIGPGRLMACVAERNHDAAGPVWPAALAPFSVSVLSLDREPDGEVATAAERLYQQLREAGLEVLLDDREERAGVKFADADLIGAPVRITVGSRGVSEGQVELRLRADGAVHNVGIDDVQAILRFVEQV